MAVNAYNSAARAQSPAATTSGSIFGGVRRVWARWQEEARIRGELNTMTTRELADLGLMHADINDVARGTYRRGD